MANETKKVYAAIGAVSAAMAREGISKSRSNQQQGYKFRGIDEVMNALASVLVEHQLLILPRMLTRDATSYQAKSGGTIFNVAVEAEFDFVSIEDGSIHTVKMFGEAMDSADKATNKAMSAAFKYAAFQAFCIPTEGDNDADATTHEIAHPSDGAKAKPKPAAKSQVDLRKASDLKLTGPQRERLALIANTHGWLDAKMKPKPSLVTLLEGYGAKGSGDVKQADYDALITDLEAGVPE